MIRAYLRAASFACSSLEKYKNKQSERKTKSTEFSNYNWHLLAPVQTIFPEEKIRAVVRGSRIRMMTAANRLGLYSALRALSAIDFSSSLQPRFTVQTIFL